DARPGTDPLVGRVNKLGEPVVRDDPLWYAAPGAPKDNTGRPVHSVLVPWRTGRRPEGKGILSRGPTIRHTKKSPRRPAIPVARPDVHLVNYPYPAFDRPPTRGHFPMRLTRHRLCILCAALAALTAWLVRAVPFARAEGGQVSFINEVAPILKENCFACHDAKKRSGKFDMTSFEKLMTGGAGGEGITAGKHDDSELYALIVSQKERRMPPRKDNLSPVPPTQTEVVKKWIDQGAKLDTGLDPKADLV